jgi:hypothetical protein
VTARRCRVCGAALTPDEYLSLCRRCDAEAEETPFALIVDGRAVDRFATITDALDHLPTDARPWQIADPAGEALVWGEGAEITGRVVVGLYDHEIAAIDRRRDGRPVPGVAR